MASTVPAEDDVRVLFVCTANRIRSPFAAAVAARLAAEHALTITVGSAGSMEPDQPAEDEMQRVARSMGFDLSAHRSRTTDDRLLQRSDLIVTMTGRHVLEVVERHPSLRHRTLTLKEWAAWVQAEQPVPEWTAEGVRDWAAAATDRPFDRLVSGGDDIADPVGRTRRQYRRTAELIRDLVGVGLDVHAEATPVSHRRPPPGSAERPVWAARPTRPD